jgi:phosphoserine phosphatase
VTGTPPDSGDSKRSRLNAGVILGVLGLLATLAVGLPSLSLINDLSAWRTWFIGGGVIAAVLFVVVLVVILRAATTPASMKLRELVRRWLADDSEPGPIAPAAEWPVTRRVGVFLDVDLTLTEEVIQRAYANKLNLEEDFVAIEEQFQHDKDADKFGDRLCELFAKAGQMTEARARRDLYPKAILRKGVDRILQLDRDPLVDVHLVSSGPNYFIESLANTYGIPYDASDPHKSQVICSIYDFDAKLGTIEKCSRPINSEDKANFVKAKIDAGNYALTVGVGDSEAQDAKFLTHCAIKVMMETNSEANPTFDPAAPYVFIKRLYPLALMLERTVKALNHHPR